MHTKLDSWTVKAEEILMRLCQNTILVGTGPRCTKTGALHRRNRSLVCHDLSEVNIFVNDISNVSGGESFWNLHLGNLRILFRFHGTRKMVFSPIKAAWLPSTDHSRSARDYIMGSLSSTILLQLK